MNQEYFVREDSVVRQIWGRSDMILFIFAGGAAEFALNKAVDWLYFTGKLPADPVGRLFSTVGYAKMIVFAKRDKALDAIDRMVAIHAGVEANRKMRIPDWAYRDVLYMLIDYSIRSYEIFERRMTAEERAEVFGVFNEVGIRMGIGQLPATYEEWEKQRQVHLEQDLAHSEYTEDLFIQYQKHLGGLRYLLLLEAMKLIVPVTVRELLGLRSFSVLRPVIAIYKITRVLNLDHFIRKMALPPKYRREIRKLESARIA